MSRIGRGAVAGILLVAAGVVAVASPWADADPDGLERVAIAHGFAERDEGHAFADGPLGGYRLRGIDGVRPATAAAGLAGVAITFGISVGLFGFLRARRSRRK